MIASMSTAFAEEMQGVEAELRIALEACRKRKRRRRPRGPRGRRRYRTGEAGARVLAAILSGIAFWERAGGLHSGRDGGGSSSTVSRDPSLQPGDD